MLDVDTFLTTVYVAVDEYCQTRLRESRLGPPSSVSPSEVVPLALFSQWAEFPSERAFYRYAQRHLRAAFPTLPHRRQFNRLVRPHHDRIVRGALQFAQLLDVAQAPYEVLDCLGIAVRHVHRRGHGWLVGIADRHWCSRLGWFFGLTVLTAVTPEGVITGFGGAPGATTERPFTDDFLAQRQLPDPPVASGGRPAPSQPYLADTGFAGRAVETHLRQAYGVSLVASPPRGSARRWPTAARRWAASHRQIIETVHERLLQTTRLERERPHALDGLLARLAAKVGLHNFCCWLNRQRAQPLLAVADLIDW